MNKRFSDEYNDYNLLWETLNNKNVLSFDKTNLILVITHSIDGGPENVNVSLYPYDCQMDAGKIDDDFLNNQTNSFQRIYHERKPGYVNLKIDGWFTKGQISKNYESVSVLASKVQTTDIRSRRQHKRDRRGVSTVQALCQLDNAREKLKRRI